MRSLLPRQISSEAPSASDLCRGLCNTEKNITDMPICQEAKALVRARGGVAYGLDARDASGVQRQQLLCLDMVTICRGGPWVRPSAHARQLLPGLRSLPRNNAGAGEGEQTSII